MSSRGRKASKSSHNISSTPNKHLESKRIHIKQTHKKVIDGQCTYEASVNNARESCMPLETGTADIKSSGRSRLFYSSDEEQDDINSIFDQNVSKIQSFPRKNIDTHFKERKFFKRSYLETPTHSICISPRTVAQQEENVSKVFKILSKSANTPNLSDNKSLSKLPLKTYSTPKAAKSRVIESFGLPDNPIVPLIITKEVNLDVGITDAKEVTVLDLPMFQVDEVLPVKQYEKAPSSSVGKMEVKDDTVSPSKSLSPDHKILIEKMRNQIRKLLSESPTRPKENSTSTPIKSAKCNKLTCDVSFIENTSADTNFLNSTSKTETLFSPPSKSPKIKRRKKYIHKIANAESAEFRKKLRSSESCDEYNKTGDDYHLSHMGKMDKLVPFKNISKSRLRSKKLQKSQSEIQESHEKYSEVDKRKNSTKTKSPNESFELKILLNPLNLNEYLDCQLNTMGCTLEKSKASQLFLEHEQQNVFLSVKNGIVNTILGDWENTDSEIVSMNRKSTSEISSQYEFDEISPEKVNEKMTYKQKCRSAVALLSEQGDVNYKTKNEETEFEISNIKNKHTENYEEKTKEEVDITFSDQDPKQERKMYFDIGDNNLNMSVIQYKLHGEVKNAGQDEIYVFETTNNLELVINKENIMMNAKDLEHENVTFPINTSPDDNKFNKQTETELFSNKIDTVGTNIQTNELEELNSETFNVESNTNGEHQHKTEKKKLFEVARQNNGEIISKNVSNHLVEKITSEQAKNKNIILEKLFDNSLGNIVDSGEGSIFKKSLDYGINHGNMTKSPMRCQYSENIRNMLRSMNYKVPIESEHFKNLITDKAIANEICVNSISKPVASLVNATGHPISNTLDEVVFADFPLKNCTETKTGLIKKLCTKFDFSGLENPVVQLENGNDSQNFKQIEKLLSEETIFHQQESFDDLEADLPSSSEINETLFSEPSGALKNKIEHSLENFNEEGFGNEDYQLKDSTKFRTFLKKRCQQVQSSTCMKKSLGCLEKRKEMKEVPSLKHQMSEFVIENVPDNMNKITEQTNCLHNNINNGYIDEVRKNNGNKKENIKNHIDNQSESDDSGHELDSNNKDIRQSESDVKAEQKIKCAPRNITGGFQTKQGFPSSCIETNISKYDTKLQKRETTNSRQKQQKLGNSADELVQNKIEMPLLKGGRSSSRNSNLLASNGEEEHSISIMQNVESFKNFEPNLDNISQVIKPSKDKNVISEKKTSDKIDLVPKEQKKSIIMTKSIGEDVKLMDNVLENMVIKPRKRGRPRNNVKNNNLAREPIKLTHEATDYGEKHARNILGSLDETKTQINLGEKAGSYQNSFLNTTEEKEDQPIDITSLNESKHISDKEESIQPAPKKRGRPPKKKLIPGKTNDEKEIAQIEIGYKIGQFEGRRVISNQVDLEESSPKILEGFESAGQSTGIKTTVNKGSLHQVQKVDLEQIEAELASIEDNKSENSFIQIFAKFTRSKSRAAQKNVKDELTEVFEDDVKTFQRSKTSLGLLLKESTEFTRKSRGRQRATMDVAELDRFRNRRSISVAPDEPMVLSQRKSVKDRKGTVIQQILII